MSQIPDIKVAPPGPKARKIIEEDSRFVSPSYTRSYPLVIESGEGMSVTDVDGNIFLDFTAGIAVNSTGHCHPDIVAVIKEQADKFIHMSGTDFYYSLEVELAKLLSEAAPGNVERKSFFTNSGAESLEASLKLSRYYTKRGRLLAFSGAFHGRTMGALSLSASKSLHQKGFFPLVPGVHHAPYAYCYRCAYGLDKKDCGTYCLKWIEEELFKTELPPSELAAIFVEPIQGEGGYIVPPPEFLKGLEALAKKYECLLVADEVQSGMGRTGAMFASEHFGIEPDIIAVAKGIASGMPLGAAIAKSELMTWESGAHANTFGGNPISCAAAIKTIKLLQEGLIENARQMGIFLSNSLKELQSKYEIIGDVRGIGLMAGVELVRNRETKERADRERNEIVNKCFNKGLLILGAGRNVIRFMPSLIVTQKETEKAIEIFSDVLKEYH